MGAKLVLGNGVEFEFNESCSIEDKVVTIDDINYDFNGKKIEVVIEDTPVEVTEEEGPKRHKIYSGMLTPDGTLLSSVGRHDYVTHEDKNGNHYMLDGGTDYVRCSDPGDAEFISVYIDEPIEKTREVTGRSGYGDPDEKDYGTRWRCARLCEMSDDWVKGSIDYVSHELLKKQYQDELDYRKANKIEIKDEGQQYHADWPACWSNIDVEKIK